MQATSHDLALEWQSCGRTIGFAQWPNDNQPDMYVHAVDNDNQPDMYVHAVDNDNQPDNLCTYMQ